ncbi:DNA-binding IscR family transcriptional regulator [Bacillus sp. LEw-kw-24]|uniref:MarR family transcriptional regulator n=1 Tax=unclassified Bacillus (in: firmicutes) TaxID=185979 RepID=UPI0024067D72|nr:MULTISPECIES: MarR family transcriptional regulator [unclassified Bacillus (in: firmicutes)]MDF9886691.1 DNA-binding IscR family transcriptional regulator [Bacillus sp. LEw-kw-24]MDH6557489.1 DNA-binding IscR family transcriptional regulator [Bacillus sp. LEw-kw-2]
MSKTIGALLSAGKINTEDIQYKPFNQLSNTELDYIAKMHIENRGGKVTTGAQLEQQKKYSEKKANRDTHHFSMQIKERYETIKENLTLQQHGLLLFLATCMRFGEDGKLFTDKGKRVNVKELTIQLGKTRSQLNKILSELEANGVIQRVTEGKTTYIDMTDAVYICGKLEGDYKTVKLFKAHLHEKAKDLPLNTLGLFALLLTYMNWKTNLIVENPDEQDTRKLVLLKRSHLVDLLGISKNTINKLMGELNRARLIVEVKTITDAICLDPKAVSRQAKKITFEELLDNIEEASLSVMSFKKANKKGCTFAEEQPINAIAM